MKHKAPSNIAVTVNYRFERRQLTRAAVATSVQEVQAALHRLATHEMERLPIVDLYIHNDGMICAYYFTHDSTTAVGVIDAVPENGKYVYDVSPALTQWLQGTLDEAWVQAHIEDAERTLRYWQNVREDDRITELLRKDGIHAP
jgi:hypothetical protein